jgi:tetratricopeptide (TPR) repeat protein
MNFFALLALFLWLPIVVGIFVSQLPRRAVVISFVFAWLALPNISFNLPGLPDYSKMSATVMGVLLSSMAFDQSRFLSIRPRWYDAPMIVWCLSPFVSAISSDLGVYEGASSVLDQCFAWGLPYLIGRAYFKDLESLRELALGIAIGGLIYAPLCLFEIRFSPCLKTWIYGIYEWEGMRLGGYRPVVFLSVGLELGMWMTNATLVAYQLWACGTVKRLRDVSFGALTLGLTATTVLCRSTGALALLAFGMFALWVTKRIGKTWLVWVLIAIPCFYTSTRTLHLWSGREVVDLAAMAIDAERAQSFGFRLENEEILTRRALERPLFGWGRFGGFMSKTADGKWSAIVDGYWLVTLGLAGCVGLATLVVMMLQPIVLTIRRFPASTWSDPEVGPAVVLALLLALMMLDFLSNAMLNPIYALTMGAVLGVTPTHAGRRRREAEASLSTASTLMGEGRLAEAGLEFRRTIGLVPAQADDEGRRVLAEALDGLGLSLLATGDPWGAEAAFREALVVRDQLAAEVSDPGRFRDLAIARESLSRALVEVGRSAEAVHERQIALQIWDILTANHPKKSDLRDHRIDALNDLAWLLSTDSDAALRDPPGALRLAEEAVRASADRVACWNTLGVARYRAGDWPGAIEALERSAADGPDGGSAFDYFFLAMACRRLDDAPRAREWFELGVAWATRHRPGHPALERFREEAEALLGDPGRASVDVS